MLTTTNLPPLILRAGIVFELEAAVDTEGNGHLHVYGYGFSAGFCRNPAGHFFGYAQGFFVAAAAYAL